MSAAADGMGRQIRQNLVALISLVLAIASLGYTTWRNESSEAHRNVRQAAFRTLEVLEELQVIVDARRYQGDKMRGDYVAGWARVNLISDLGLLIPGPQAQVTDELRKTWQANFDKWYTDNDADAEARISAAIGATREATLGVLGMLR